MFVDADEARANGRSDPVSGPAQSFFDRWNALQASSCKATWRRAARR